MIILVPIVVSDAANGQNKIHPDLMGHMTDLSFNHTEEKIRVIVMLNEQYNPPQFQSTQSFLDKKQDHKEVVQSMKMQVHDSQSRILDSLEDKKKNGKVKQVRTLWLVNAIVLEATPEVIEELSRREDVAEIIPDFVVHLVEEPSIQGEAGILSGTPVWGVEKINATDVWDMGFNGTGINVSIIDTGINYSHPDLQANYKLGYDFVNNDQDPMDDEGHGTHVAGTVSGTGVEGYKTGVAPGANLFAAKVLDSDGDGNYSDIIEGVGWSVANGADVVSLSFGGPHESSMTAMVNNTIAAGVLPVIAAGNDGRNGSSTIMCPGDEINATTVGATDSNDNNASFSSIGPVNLSSETYIKPDVVAPGLKILSTSWLGGYINKSGTSMATPHVSGAAALILQAYPDMSPLEVKQLLEYTAVDLGTSGKDNYYGSGRIDVLEAIMAPLPLISNITIYPNTTNINSTINATISHYIHNISYAGFYIDDDMANVSAMSAKDGSFNSTIENVTGLINITTLQDGEHNVTFQAQHSKNYWNNQTSEVFTVDKTPPTIILNTPLNKSNIIINLSIEDVVSGINNVIYNYNGTNVSLFYPYDIDISNWPEGLTTVHVWSYDKAGNVNHSSFNLSIDNTPLIIISVMHNGTGILNSDDVLWVNLTEIGGNESYFTIEDTSINQSLDKISSGYFSTNYTIPAGLEIKDKVLTCYLSDEAGNTISSEADGNISIDSLAPRINLVSPANNSFIRSGTIIDLTISDVFLANGTYNYNGTNMALLSPFEIDTTGWNEGAYNLTIWANDTKNNSSTKTYHFTIDDSKPSAGSSGGGGGGGSSGEERNNILVEKSERINIFLGDHVSYSFEDISILYVNFTSKTSVGWIKSTIEVLKSTSTQVNTPAPLNVYKNVNIWVGLFDWANEQTIANASISFKVPIEWIKSNNIDEGSIKLYRYNNNTWNPLPTTRVNQDEINFYYNSPTPGFSPFAITGKSKPTLLVKQVPIPAPAIIENNSAPSNKQVRQIESQNHEGNVILWILVIIIILSIAAAGFILKKR
ncbi:MAG: S8 family serine peptidase [Methanosarcinales archaeon]|nr:S8 family serine peptidase [Methanosarcinales archaeon]